MTAPRRTALVQLQLEPLAVVTGVCTGDTPTHCDFNVIPSGAFVLPQPPPQRPPVLLGQIALPLG